MIRDVTARQRAEEALRDSEARFRAFLEHTADSMVVHDGSGRILDVNDRLCSTLGYTRNELLSMNVADLDATVDLASKQEHWHQAQAGSTISVEAWHRRKDGTTFPVEVRDGCFESNGQRFFIGTVRDITERKVHEEALRRSEEQFRQLFETTLLGVIYHNANGEVVSANQAAECMLGQSVAEMRGRRSIDPRLRAIYADGSPFPGDLHPAITALRTGKPVDGVVMGILNPKRNAMIWLEVSAVPLFRAGETAPSSAYTLSQDISARKAADDARREMERRLRSHYDLGHVGLAVTSPSKGWIDVNTRLCELLGYTREELLSRTWSEMTHPDDIHADVAQFNRALEGEIDGYRIDKRFIRKDGSVIYIDLSVRCLRSPDGRAQEFVALLDDITPRKTAEAEREKLIEALRLADQRKNEFLATLSHELRNPLAPIRNGLYILDRVVPGGEQAHRAQGVINRQVEHLARLVDDLLDVTRITRGKVLLQCESVDLNDIVKRTLDDHLSVFATNGVHAEFLPASRTLQVHGDRARLAQAIGNLLLNAAKFTHRGGTTTVAIEEDATRAQAVLSVRDTGIGIAAHTMARLFEPFTQADTSLDRSQGGLGLGLSLVKGLVELHRGTIEATSAGLGKGATFTIRLPLENASPSTQALRNGHGGMTASRRILVIEDNVDAADTLREMLELSGHIVVTAHDGPDGMQRARVLRPDVVLCDIGLPGMDGYAVGRAMRAAPELRSTTLVALTGYAGPDDVERAKAAGYNAHLAKPPDMDALEQLLARAGAADVR